MFDKPYLLKLIDIEFVEYFCLANCKVRRLCDIQAWRARRERG